MIPSRSRENVAPISLPFASSSRFAILTCGRVPPAAFEEVGVACAFDGGFTQHLTNDN